MSFSLAQELEGAQGAEGFIWICTSHRALYIFLPDQLLHRAQQKKKYNSVITVAMEKVEILLASV